MKENEDFNLMILSLKNGSMTAFENLYNCFYGDLCNYALKFSSDRNLIEDIVQDTFVDLWVNKKRLKINTSLRGYLHKIVHNKLMDAFKSHTKSQKAYSYLYQESSFQNFIDTLETNNDYRTEQIDKLKDCIKKLPKRCKTVFLESKIHRLKYVEISEKLGISIKTVEGHIKRGYISLKKCMDKKS